jgi:hypothetical protein
MNSKESKFNVNFQEELAEKASADQASAERALAEQALVEQAELTKRLMEHFINETLSPKARELHKFVAGRTRPTYYCDVCGYTEDHRCHSKA